MCGCSDRAAPAAGSDAASLSAQTGVHLLQGLNLASVGAETDRRGFVPVNEKMQVLDTKGKPVPGVWCIGDANGEMQLQHSFWLAQAAVCCMAAIPLLLTAALCFMLARWAPADGPACQSSRVVQMLSQLCSMCCREVHACTCCQRPGHQRRGEHVRAPTCAQPYQRPSCLLHPPRGTSCSGLETCDHNFVAFGPLEKWLAASAAVGRSADRRQLLCGGRWLCRLSGSEACILVCIAYGCS